MGLESVLTASRCGYVFVGVAIVVDFGGSWLVVLLTAWLLCWILFFGIAVSGSFSWFVFFFFFGIFVLFLLWVLVRFFFFVVLLVAGCLTGCLGWSGWFFGF